MLFFIPLVARAAVFSAFLFGVFGMLVWLFALSPYLAAGTVTLLGFLLFVGFSLHVSRSREEAVRQMEAELQKMGRGESSAYQYFNSFPDLTMLSAQARSIILQLSSQLTAELRKKNESEAVLASMMEGVVAVDSDEKILSLNEAACQLLRIEQKPDSYKSIQEVVRNSQFQQLVSQALISHHSIESEVQLLDQEQTILEVKASPLRDSSGESIGAVLVFHDITQLRKLESIRRDFVANVSHELKTPITSIKGFVETLLDGALENTDDTQRFLTIVVKQADRLSAIIEDLLSLSRLEQEESPEAFITESLSAADLVQRSIQPCLLKVQEKSIGIECTVPEDLFLRGNGHLLEQALTNLLTNAIKYSPEQGRVVISSKVEGEEVTFTVQDFGVGIAPEHLPRLFERFYRVDKARSRTLGGTGLGLAIVKHIAQVHGGFVSVESDLNEGSVFGIHLPKALVEDPLLEAGNG